MERTGDGHELIPFRETCTWILSLASCSSWLGGLASPQLSLQKIGHLFSTVVKSTLTRAGRVLSAERAAPTCLWRHHSELTLFRLSCGPRHTKEAVLNLDQQ